MRNKHETSEFKALLQGLEQPSVTVAINNVLPHGRLSWVVLYSSQRPGRVSHRVAIVTETAEGNLYRRTDFMVD